MIWLTIWFVILIPHSIHVWYIYLYTCTIESNRMKVNIYHTWMEMVACLQSFTCSEQTANLPWSSNLAMQILPRSLPKIRFLEPKWPLHLCLLGLETMKQRTTRFQLKQCFPKKCIGLMPASWLLLGGLGFQSGLQYDVMISSGWEYLLFSPRELKLNTFDSCFSMRCFNHICIL